MIYIKPTDVSSEQHLVTPQSENHGMRPVRLILVGGFLGAGKTTLLTQAAQRFASQGQRVGLITNDQAARLVDTTVLRHAGGSEVREVSGGCFCCKFNDLVSAADELIQEHNPDIIIGEPVGSCTDLSATVLQPLKKNYGERFRVLPFSVLVDVCQMGSLNRLWQSFQEDSSSAFPDDVLYIYRKQLEEADLIVLNKIDLVSHEEAASLERLLADNFPNSDRVAISALTGKGVASWLDSVLQDAPGGRRIADVDYDTYAGGEAALAWLNASIRLESETETDWRFFCLDFMERVPTDCRAMGAEIAHVKVQLACSGKSVVANLTNNVDAPSLRGPMGEPSKHASLLVNARVLTTPQELRTVIERCLRAAARDDIEVTTESIESFSPARPTPVHRFDHVE